MMRGFDENAAPKLKISLLKIPECSLLRHFATFEATEIFEMRRAEQHCIRVAYSLFAHWKRGYSSPDTADAMRYDDATIETRDKRAPRL